MYYLYQKKPKSDGDTAVTEGSTLGPVTVHSSQQPQQHQQTHLSRPNVEEGATSIVSSEAPEGGRRPSSSMVRRGRPGAESETAESKEKDEQLVRRMLRRRGLEEHDFTEEVMQPRRPQRIACQRCQHDITPSDSQHRIICNDRDKHMFCKSCVCIYVEGWVRGEATYELRQNRMGSSRGLHALPCMSPRCQQGCFTEVCLQPLLSHPMFVEHNQKIAQARAKESRGRSLQDVLSESAAPTAPSLPPPRQHSQQEQQPSHPGVPPSYPQQQQTRLHLHSYQQQMNQQTNSQQQQQDFELSQRQQHQYHQQQTHMLQQQQQEQQQLVQHQQRLQERRQQRHLLDQQQEMIQQHQQNAPLPFAPALRRTSSASTCKTTTTKSVRFSIQEAADDLLEDVASVASSNSSLTTRFPVSLDDQQPESEDHSGEEQLEQVPQQPPNSRQQHILQQHTPQQQQQAHLTAALLTCKCCYEEFDTRSTQMTSCNPRQSNAASHTFCCKCFRLYIEEWLFGAATYTMRPGTQDTKGQTALVLPCLFGDCSGGGFSDERVAESLSKRMMEQYLEKIASLRDQEEEQEEKLVKMAIRLSMEQEQIQKKLDRMHGEQQSLAKRGQALVSPLSSDVHVHMTNLSATSSLTSFNTAFQHTAVSAPVGLGNMKYTSSRLAAARVKSATEQDRDKLEKSVHDVEEAMTSAKVRQCPNCNTKFLKDKDFCNKLKCPSCKTAICYICRHVVPTQGYEHFCIHKQGGCGDCLGLHCPLWTLQNDDNQRDLTDMRARGLEEANRIWEESLLDGQPGAGARSVEIRVDVDKLLEQPDTSPDR